MLLANSCVAASLHSRVVVVVFLVGLTGAEFYHFFSMAFPSLPNLESRYDRSGGAFVVVTQKALLYSHTNWFGGGVPVFQMKLEMFSSPHPNEKLLACQYHQLQQC